MPSTGPAACPHACSHVSSPCSTLSVVRALLALTFRTRRGGRSATGGPEMFGMQTIPLAQRAVKKRELAPTVLRRSSRRVAKCTHRALGPSTCCKRARCAGAPGRGLGHATRSTAKNNFQHVLKFQRSWMRIPAGASRRTAVCRRRAAAGAHHVPVDGDPAPLRNHEDTYLPNVLTHNSTKFHVRRGPRRRIGYPLAAWCARYGAPGRPLPPVIATHG